MADILLESGTNEMELLVFRLADTRFGINVAKVREIIQRPQIIPIPHSPEAVEGSFQLRDEVLTLVNVGRHFDMEGKETKAGEGLIIIVELNNQRCGVLVDAVEIIHRMRWDEIESPSRYLTDLDAPLTGVARVNDNIVMIVDFETIIGKILGFDVIDDIETDEENVVDRKDVRVLLADDSNMVRISLERILKKSGYSNLTICSDGQEAWDAISANSEAKEKPYDIILSDIEMPRMDGLHLTSRIKSDPVLKEMPVILFSSLITEDNRKKGERVGADAQLSKPQSGALIEAMEKCLEKYGCITA